MSPKAADPLAQADLAAANRALDLRLYREKVARWQPVWTASGIGFAGESMESMLGVVRARGDAAERVVPVGDADLAVGDLVALRDDTDPSDSNQHLHRVVEMRPAKGGNGSVAFLGPALPRAEWPEAMREATVPTSLYVESAYGGGGFLVNVSDGQGRAVCSLPGSPEEADIRVGYLAATVAGAARLGYADGLEGRRRTFELVKGNGGPAKNASYWQIADDLGQVSDVERRSLLRRRPSEFAEAVLLSTRAAYVDGMTEALDVKAARDMAAAGEGQAPRM